MRSVKVFMLLCVLISGLAFAQESSQATAKRPSRMYMAAELGVLYTHYGLSSEEFNGFGPGFGFKFGGSTRSQALAFFATASYAPVFGSLDGDDASGYRFILGGGTAFYPFDGGDSPMHGAFVGVSAAIVMLAADRDGQNVFNTLEAGSRADMESQGFSLAVELGKTWPVTEKWRLGFAVTAAMDLPVVYGEGEYENSVYSIGANLRFSRK